MDWDSLKFDERGLIPAIVQDAATKRVLTLAYMNRESLQISLDEKRTCFYSRSRQELWRKGETSGNTQEIVSITADCDGDALLVQVNPAGPACHTGAGSCFFAPVSGESQDFCLEDLYRLLSDRRKNPKEGSYTSYLFEKGQDKILKKIGEETTEVIIGAKNRDSQELIYELADLAYHVLVLMAEEDITPGQIRQELAGRHVVDHKVKQEHMK